MAPDLADMFCSLRMHWLPTESHNLSDRSAPQKLYLILYIDISESHPYSIVFKKKKKIIHQTDICLVAINNY